LASRSESYYAGENRAAMALSLEVLPTLLADEVIH
jgi:hypothetical protein